MSKDGVHDVVPHFAGGLAAPVGVDDHQQPPGPAWQLLHSCLELPLPLQDHLLALHRPEASPLCMRSSAALVGRCQGLRHSPCLAACW